MCMFHFHLAPALLCHPHTAFHPAALCSLVAACCRLGFVLKLGLDGEYSSLDILIIDVCYCVPHLTHIEFQPDCLAHNLLDFSPQDHVDHFPALAC